MPEQIARDPRVDPQIGDTLRNGRVSKVVTKRRGLFVYWRTRVGRGERPERCHYVAFWRKWAANAEVVKVASPCA